MRHRTSDIPLRTLPHPEHGAVRSYTTRGGSFVLSHMRQSAYSAPGTWRLTHQPSGATPPVSSMSEGVALIRRLQSAPLDSEGATQRFVILPRTSPMGGVVLFDRVTGRWFPRSSEQPVQQRELDEMALLHPANGTEWQMELQLSTHSNAASRTIEAERAPSTPEAQAAASSTSRRAR